MAEIVEVLNRIGATLAITFIVQFMALIIMVYYLATKGK